MLFQTCTKLTFGLCNILVIIVIARNKLNSAGSLFFLDQTSVWYTFERVLESGLLLQQRKFSFV